jgi:glycosyltransferase involved in cell wall biosynthesis
MVRAPEAADAPVRIVRIIARLNIGGPSIQAITLAKRLEDHGYRTVLVRGREEPDEGNMDYLANELGVQPVLIRSLRRNPGWHDVRALIELTKIIRRERPQIVHTHAAKAGTLGRVATLIAFPLKRSRPSLIHTYHGHSLTGYFPPRVASVYRRIEQLLARITDRLVAVSQEVRGELVAMGVAPPTKFVVVPLGFDLSAFAVNGDARRQMRSKLRSELGIPESVSVVTLIARLVPIKRVDRFLRVAAALSDLPDTQFLIVGDGELRDELQRSQEAFHLDGRLTWAGFRRDMPAVYVASDVIVQTSDNEGTPVALIEAQAAGVPVISTNVGGTASAVLTTDSLVSTADERGLEQAIRALLSDRHARGTAAVGHKQVLARFDFSRLVEDILEIYRALLDACGGAYVNSQKRTSG